MTFGKNRWSRILEAVLLALPAALLAVLYIARLVHFRVDLSAHPGTPAETLLALFVMIIVALGLRVAWFAFKKGLGITLFTLALMFAVVLVGVLSLIIRLP
jgi:hypothetical protein